MSFVMDIIETIWNLLGELMSSELSTAEQRVLWRSQAGSPPDLLWGKDEVFDRTLALLSEIHAGRAVDLDGVPESGEETKPWRHYSGALRRMGVVENRRGALHLTADGEELLLHRSRSHLGTLIAGRTRLFAETLELLVAEPMTTEDINAALVSSYNLDWTSLAGTRSRLTWLEVLGLIEWLGDRKLTASSDGRQIIADWPTVDPTALDYGSTADAAELPKAPIEIAALLERLAINEDAQRARSTYNIWVPSPSTDPSKIENMRISIAAATEPIEKEELLSFIADRFDLKRSSVESMLPFMRAGGFLYEVRRGVFAATPVAREWLESGSEIDFVRILHGNMRFVGELVNTASETISRSDLYDAGAAYGLNTEKIRWLIAFAIEAGLLIATSWSSVQSSPLGRALVATLPLAKPLSADLESGQTAKFQNAAIDTTSADSFPSAASGIAADLIRTARDPSADAMGSGVGFETAIERAFDYMGFIARRIGGSGNTDVLVQWQDSDGTARAAVVDAKSTSSGQIAHTNVSDVAIGAHQDKHTADFAAIVAPAFTGETIRNMAQKKGWALITATELGEVVVAAEAFGLSPVDVAIVFNGPGGWPELAALIESRRRELELIELVITRLYDELANDEAVSPRDISLIERRSALAPTIDELIATFALLASANVGAVTVADQNDDAKHETYRLAQVRPVANRLRALASAMENGIGPSGRLGDTALER